MERRGRETSGNPNSFSCNATEEANWLVPFFRWEGWPKGSRISELGSGRVRRLQSPGPESQVLRHPHTGAWGLSCTWSLMWLLEPPLPEIPLSSLPFTA